MAETETRRERGHAMEEFREQAATTRDDVRDLGSKAKAAAQEKLQETRERASAAYKSGRQKASSLAEDMVGQVREKPVRSMLIAAGAGLALGFLFTRRRG